MTIFHTRTSILRLWVQRGLLASTSLAASLVLAEWVVRVVSPQSASWLAIYQPHPRLPYSLRVGHAWVVATGETEWTIVTDSQGMRVVSGAEVRPEDPHWLVIGDSFAFGHGCNASDSIPARLSLELGIKVANAAIPGFGPVQYRLALEEHLVRGGVSAVVVIGFLGNDFHDLGWSKLVPIHQGLLGGKQGLKSSLRRKSHLYRFISARLHNLGWGGAHKGTSLEHTLIDPGRFERELAGGRELWIQEYRAMNRMCRERGVPLAVILLPPRSAVDDRLLERTLAIGDLAPKHVDVHLATRTAQNWLREAGIEAIDTTEYLQRIEGPIYFTFDGHFRARTNHVLARYLAPDLLRSLRQ